MTASLTPKERHYLDQLLSDSGSLRTRLIVWGLEIVPGAAFFAYGVATDRLLWEVLGFLSVVYFQVWRMYGQLRGRRMLQSIYRKTIEAEKNTDA